jgi:hypothetical protein
MAYSTSNPPRLVSQPVAGLRMWQYTSTDAVATVRVAGYFSNGWDLGMRAGDLVAVLDNDASPITGSFCWVTSATAADGVDLSDGVTITGTDTD